MERDFDELFDAYMEQNELYRNEGRKGLENLCQVVRGIGYKDPQYYGQLSAKASIGDLMCFLEDNSGAIEAILNWIRDTGSSEFKAALEEQVVFDEEDDTEEV